MTKRSLFLTVAAGLLASIAFATPSQANTVVTTTASFTIITPGGDTVTDLMVSYTPSVDPISNLTIVSSTGLGTPTITETSANTVEVAFNATSSGSVVFSFTTNTSPTGLGATTVAPVFSGQLSPVTSANTTLLVSAVAVPEPTSIALLGIGMTGFLAFRRLFKRTAVA